MALSKQKTISGFLKDCGANKLQLIKNPNTGKTFFVIPGFDITGKVSKKIQESGVLSPDHFISWATEDDGVGCWMLHTSNSSNEVDSFSI